MNTPKTPKPLRRYNAEPRKRPLSLPGGYWGIKEPAAAALFGQLVSYWPHVEDAIIPVFYELVSGHSLSGENQGAVRATREIFRSIVSQQLRIKIMKKLLEESPHNSGKGEIYDEVIEEFYSINKIRSDYVHGLWLWNHNDKKLLLYKPSAEHMFTTEPRHVSTREFETVLDRMRVLWEKITTLLSQQS